MALEQLQTTQGIDVYVDHIPTAHTANIATTVNIGSVHEEPGQAGLAHVLEHAVHLTSEQFPAKPDLLRYRGLQAMSANASTSYVQTRYHANGPELEPIINQMSEIICRPIFEPSTIDPEMEVITEEARRRLADNSLLHELSIDHVLSGSPHGRDIIGYSDNIKYSTQEVQDFYDKYYHLGNMKVVGVGNVSLGQLVELVEQYFTPTSARFTVPEPQPAVNGPLRDIRSGHVVESENATISQAAKLAPDLKEEILADPQVFFAAENALSTRLQQVLRNDKGIAYTASFGISMYNHRDAWRLGSYTSVAPKNIATAEAEAMALVAGGAEQFSSDEILAAIGLQKGQALAAMDNVVSRANSYASNLKTYGVPRSLDEKVARVRTMQEGDVRNAIARLLTSFGEGPVLTHVTGTAEAIGEVDYMVPRRDII